jgi:hypothetical protein
MPPVNRPARLALLALGAALTLAGGYLSAGPPRITLLNAALRIEYPWARGAGGLVAALGLAMLAALMTRSTWRRIGFVLALGPLLIAGHLLLWKLEITDSSFSFRGLFGTTTMAWSEVASINVFPGSGILVESRSGAKLHLDTTDFAADQRASVERTLARHVKEGSGPEPRIVVPN